MSLPISRRRLLVMGAVIVGAGACSDDQDGATSGEPAGSSTGPAPSDGTDSPASTALSTTTAPASTPDAGSSVPAPPQAELTVADFDSINACVLTPEQTSGPFYLRTDLVRRGISEGRPGSPLRVGLRVEDATDCRPVEGARVDIWHADLFGDYSAYIDGSYENEEGEGTTFMRGTQFSDPDGLVEFATVFPGWYPARALHIHVMVYLGRTRALTTQMYFSEDVIADVYRSAPYSDRGLPDMPTSRDRIAGDPAAQGLEMEVSGDDTGRSALLRLHIPAEPS